MAKNTQIQIIVLMGGMSQEHEISIISGREVVINLDSKKYNILPVVISKDGKTWWLTDKESLLKIKPKDIVETKGSSRDIVLASKSEYKSGSQNINSSKSIVFIAMHGNYGEDGKIQGMLDLMGLNYTGSSVLASAIGMDKEMFRKVLVSENIKIPNYFVLTKNDKVSRPTKLPVFVKPVSGGSSIGSNIASNFREYKKAINDAFKYDDRVLVDEYIKGREVTCGILGNRNPIPLPVIEIKPLKGKFFNYTSKYTESGAEEIVPARISKALTSKIQNIALKVYKLIGIEGFGRVDFLINNKGIPVVLEVNTIPGLTPMSLLPKAAAAYGLSYGQLLDKLITYATE